jgi:predicted nucleic acid-binding protein
MRTVQMVHAPHLLDVEVVSSMRRAVRKGVIAEKRAEVALGDLQEMIVVRYGCKPFVERIWELRHNFTAYDACYLALAETLDATLLTCDAALGSAKLHRGAVEVL